MKRFKANYNVKKFVNCSLLQQGVGMNRMTRTKPFLKQANKMDLENSG